MFGIGDKKPVENPAVVDPNRAIKDALKNDGVTFKKRIQDAHIYLYGENFDLVENNDFIELIEKALRTYEMDHGLAFTPDLDIRGFVKNFHDNNQD